MSLFDYFRDRKKAPSTASMAKERLQIIVAHERGQRSQPDYLPQLQQEIIDVISKYVKIDRDQVHVALENQDDCSILELNITLPERP
ncbi:cell division topological specificity factor MinE [Halopseudomonas laoshanensis]|jgi:cell division topological specificity factor|uniref:Cell division topological specificity factor n=1 Tax=Halopseudomonas laoshanensis TaxID=2268758 RepID=A0A7V7KWV4_9GAMM|nr:cell division topological specificity factor MinE [Halopseudomonas laoshanensis]KAA0695968.1 cell division topological specificity factor MinE [Halopseudomonas laoshanensis]MBQ0744402.1 cell division topological specificity factor MinE [Pseudomonas sp.]MBQ0778436.1 cell division topological specificity factor MinE [Pseudomonas sp.]WOD10241.1 cell division topological specificity factor MinE [Pseudomonas sp. NyZ704]|tara:strand:+ start:1131 stop:1391 length:261 start_codon:yes stop_codon:yes gene_type:complete